MGFFPARPVSDSEYLLNRARAEAEMADRAEPGRAADVHHALASAYLGRLFSDGQQAAIGHDLYTIQREKRLALKTIFSASCASFVTPEVEAASENFADLLDKLE